MPLGAVTLVLISAVLHPTWNLLAKRATASDPVAFVWLTSALSAALYLPVVVALVAFSHLRLGAAPVAVLMMLGTGILHQVYFMLLQRGYRGGAFSIVYPLARGSAPLITALAAVGLFGERLGGLGFVGLATIVVAIVVIAGKDAGAASTQLATTALRRSVQYGLATGVAIAAYSLWDKAAISVFTVSPILYDFGRTVAQTIIAAPAVLRTTQQRRTLRATWADASREACGVAVLSPVAYLLVLYALTQAPVSVVAPMRESSIVIGAFLGARMFAEDGLRRRIIAAALMLAGIALLAHG